MEPDKLEYFKKILKEQKEEIVEKLVRDSETYNDLDREKIGDLVDHTFRYIEKEMLINMSSGDREVLKNIDEALDKIKNATFGSCEECGQDIGEKRLEAIPYAKKCMNCLTKKKVRRR